MLHVVGVVVLVNLLKVMIHMIIAVGGVIGNKNPTCKRREIKEK